MQLISILSLLLLLAIPAYPRTSTEWRSRTIYQILTDRFAKSDDNRNPCYNLGNYCGGTFQGIINHLDYIQGMGFDAIWISPIVTNTPGGYHGYWASNLYEINPYFGGADGLRALVDACHKRNIWVMVDIVANHMGNLERPGDFSQLHPFTDASFYHRNVDCSMINPQDQPQLETCWLSQLPDLDQDIPYVKKTLLDWIRNLVKDYKLDGLRIDTVPYIKKEFWREFTDAAGVYTLGEVFNAYLPYDAGYQGPIDGMLNYPLYFTMNYVFQQNGDMDAFRKYYEGADKTWPDSSILGNFVNNHDNPRFLYNNGDHVAFRAALAFSLTAVGIPIVYYGDEQAYGGGYDPANREPLWTNMDYSSDIYKFLKIVINFRKKNQIHLFDQIQRYSDNNFYAFTRGEFFFAFTNSKISQKREIIYHPYRDGTLLCNEFHANDCVKVENGRFPIYLENGEVKMFAPRSQSVQESIAEKFEKLQHDFLEK